MLSLHIDEDQIKCSRTVFGAIRGAMCTIISRVLTEFRS